MITAGTNNASCGPTWWGMGGGDMRIPEWSRCLHAAAQPPNDPCQALRQPQASQMWRRLVKSEGQARNANGAECACTCKGHPPPRRGSGWVRQARRVPAHAVSCLRCGSSSGGACWN